MPVIPTTQKAVVFETHGGQLLYKDVPVPVPKPHEILINIKYSGVCHSDLTTYKGEWTHLKVKLPLIGGHEGVGEVVALGSNVKGWKLGDLAGLKLINGTCGECHSCVEGNDSHCDTKVAAGCDTDGSFQQYAAADAHHAAHLPPNVSLPEVAPILCAGITAYKALKTAEVRPGQWVVISGAGGGLGTLAVQYAKAMGCLVIGVDGGADKAQMFHQLGGDEFVDFTKVADVAGAIRKLTKGGASGVVNLSDSQDALQQSLQYVRTAGTVVMVGLPPSGDLQVPIFGTVVRSLNIRGSFVGNRTDTREALDFYARGLVKSPIKIAGLSELPRIYDEMSKRAIVGRYVVDTSY